MPFIFFLAFSIFSLILTPVISTAIVPDKKEINYDLNQEKVSENDSSLSYISADSSKIAIADAKKYYHDTRPFAVCFATSVVAPPIGLVTTILVSLTKPQPHNLGIPYEKKYSLLNETYLKAYQKTAAKRKAFVACAGFITGTIFLAGSLRMVGYTPEFFFGK